MADHEPVIGSLCSGYGGLDLGVQAVLGGRVAWHVEYDKDPSAILHHHWPHVPNHGDVKTTDWTSVEPIDVLTAGYPCQPFSHAGLRKGTDDPRHLWPDVARAIGALRPRLVVLENVRGHVSLGLADVLGDLSHLGYDAAWGLVRASDAGAPHGRARIFILATDADRAGSQGPQSAAGHVLSDGCAATDAAGDRWDEGRAEPAGIVGGSDASERRGATAPDASRERHGRGQDGGGLGRLDDPDAGEARERERARGVAVDRGSAATPNAGRGQLEGAALLRDGLPVVAERGDDAPDPEGNGREGGDARGSATERSGSAVPAGPPADADGASIVGGAPGGRDAVHGHGGSDPDGRGPVIEWGPYAAAVARWEAACGRRAPAPTEYRGGRARLSPAFVEWMMGLTLGHVTDTPGLSRNAQLKALGNGVVPQQAALALRTLLPILTGP